MDTPPYNIWFTSSFSAYVEALAISNYSIVNRAPVDHQNVARTSVARSSLVMPYDPNANSDDPTYFSPLVKYLVSSPVAD